MGSRANRGRPLRWSNTRNEYKPRLGERLLRVEEAIKNQSLKRFEAMDNRFEQISKQVANGFGWTIGITSGLFVALGVLITVYQLGG